MFNRVVRRGRVLSNVERVDEESDKRMKTVDMFALEMNELSKRLRRNSVLSWPEVFVSKEAELREE